MTSDAGEAALQITCGSCGEQTVLTVLAYVRCGCGHLLLDEDQARDYRRRLGREASGRDCNER